MIQRSDAIEAINRGLANNPGVALLGPRQCGKTTLARQVAQERSQLLATQIPAAQKGGSQMRVAQPTPSGVQFFDLENPSDATALDNPMLALHQAQQGRATIAVQALGYQARSHRKDFPNQKIERRQIALVVHRAFGIHLFVRRVFVLLEVGSALEQLA